MLSSLHVAFGPLKNKRADAIVLFSKQGEETSQVKVKDNSPGYMKQAPSRGHEASPQNGLGMGCRLCSSSKKLRGLGVRA